jgi:AraC-like DNA-binding protein
VLPSGAFQIVIDLSDRRTTPLVIGLQLHYGVIQPAAIQSVMGVILRPGGARGLFDVPADAFCNQAIALDVVWDRSVTGLHDRLRDTPTPHGRFCVLEAALRQRILRRRPMHSAVEYALNEFRRLPHIRRVSEVRKDAGLSHCRFAELFREQVGLSPKIYCRLHRFQRVVGQIAAGAAVNWSDVAIVGGFCDQAPSFQRVPRVLGHRAWFVSGGGAHIPESRAAGLSARWPFTFLQDMAGSSKRSHRLRRSK